MKILSFAASNSQNSLNKQLVNYAASLIDFAEVETLDINDYEMPLYSPEREAALGEGGKQPLAEAFYKKLGEADAIIISFAEHNGSYTAAFKNLFDWTSRVDMKVYQNKPMVMLATSPGPGGAKNVLQAALNSSPYFGGDVKGSLSIPTFFEAFDAEKKVLKSPELIEQLKSLLASLKP